jgi:branched-chain amino acid transport system substrate-binding protein
LALEEINGKGGVLGKKLELISRDDGANPGEAVRVAENWLPAGGHDRRHVPVAIASRSPNRQPEESVLPCRRAAHRQDTWQNGNKYTPARPKIYMQWRC